MDILLCVNQSNLPCWPSVSVTSHTLLNKVFTINSSSLWFYIVDYVTCCNKLLQLKEWRCYPLPIRRLKVNYIAVSICCCKQWKDTSNLTTLLLLTVSIIYNLLFKSCRAAPYRLRKASQSTVDPPDCQYNITSHIDGLWCDILVSTAINGVYYSTTIHYIFHLHSFIR